MSATDKHWAFCDCLHGYPHVRGGEIGRVREDGWVEFVQFGPNYPHAPRLIVPEAEGLLIQAELDALAEGYRLARRALEKDWEDARKARLPAALSAPARS